MSPFSWSNFSFHLDEDTLLVFGVGRTSEAAGVYVMTWSYPNILSYREVRAGTTKPDGKPKLSVGRFWVDWTLER